MKIIKAVNIDLGLDFTIVINQYDNGDNDGLKSKFYQMEISHESDTGLSQKTILPLDGFEPSLVGQALIKLEA